MQSATVERSWKSNLKYILHAVRKKICNCKHSQGILWTVYRTAGLVLKDISECGARNFNLCLNNDLNHINSGRLICTPSVRLTLTANFRIHVNSVNSVAVLNQAALNLVNDLDLPDHNSYVKLKFGCRPKPFHKTAWFEHRLLVNGRMPLNWGRVIYNAVPTELLYHVHLPKNYKNIPKSCVYYPPVGYTFRKVMWFVYLYTCRKPTWCCPSNGAASLGNFPMVD